MGSGSAARVHDRWGSGLHVAFAALLMLTSLLVAVPPAAEADDEAPADVGAGTSTGREFWLAFPSALVENEDPRLELFIAGSDAGAGTVSVPGLGFTTAFTVTPGEVTTVAVPLDAMLTGQDTVEDRGVHVTADTDISVYGLNQAQFITDAYLGLPVRALGTEHLVLTWPTGFAGRSLLAVTATEDDTTITVTPSVTAGARQGGEPYTVSLDRGQTYQLKATTFGTGDLTGSEITSDAPVAVFGGHECANTPPGVLFCDHIVQQMLPTATWGSSFVTVPFIDRAGDTFRVLAGDDGTAVAIDGEVVATLDRGEFHETILTDPAHITTSRPVAVSQYMHGSQYDEGRFGDPSVVPIAPAEQYLAGYTVTTPAAGFEDHTINLVVPDAAVGAVTIDGDAVPSEAYRPIAGSGFSGAQVPVEPGSKVLSGPLPFGATMYGTNEDDSYAYPGGLSLSPVALVADLELPTTTATPGIGSEHCVVATVRDNDADPLVGIRVDFFADGVHPGSDFQTTDEAGQAAYCYTGTEAGEDTITATVGPRSSTTTVRWRVPSLPPDPDALVQSFWLYGPMYVVDADGETVDVLGDLIDALADDLGDPVALFDDVSFRETPALAPELVSDGGVIRDDVDIVAGVLTSPSAPGGAAIMVVANPRPGGGVTGPRGRHVVRAGDTVRLNLSRIGNGLPPGSTLVTGPAYGETQPEGGAPPPEQAIDPVATLAERFGEDPSTGEIRVSIAGVDGGDGQPTIAALPGQVATVDGQAGDGSLVAEFPAIDRMLQHFARFSIEGEVAMSAFFAYGPTPLGIAMSMLSVIETFFVLAGAMEEFTAYLDHMTSDGDPTSFLSPAGAATRGDPHHRTLDDHRYSFMAVGEFVAARTDGLEVQIRTVPVDGAPDVTLNSTVAVGVGTDTVVVERGDAPALINGEPVTYTQLSQTPVELDGGVVWRELGRVLIETDTGHLVQLRCGTSCAFVDVFITPAELGTGGWEGLLGTNDGDPLTSLRAPDGAVYEQPIPFETLYGTVADDWRVTTDTSLFVYGPGEDTGSFTDRGFPIAEVTVESLPDQDRQTAETVCRLAGLGDHDPTTLNECILDLALTGDACFVRSAQEFGLDFSWLAADVDPGDPDDPLCPAEVFSDVPDGHTHVEGICRAAAELITVGYADGTFRPEREVSRAELASFVARTLDRAGFQLPDPTDQGFTDLDGSVHADAINQLTEIEVVQGVVRRQRFDPNAPVTRGQLASYLVGAVAWADGQPITPEGGPHFTDTAGGTHASNIDAAFELGLTVGLGDGRYGPAVTTRRGQAATFVTRLLEHLTAGRYLA